MTKSSGNAVVNVSVTVAPDPNGGVIITCSPNPVPVTKVSTLISFNLDTRGYRFATTNAIALDTPAPDFPYASWTLTPTSASLYDLCNDNDLFKYTVNIVDVITDATYSVDPEIKNGGQNDC